MNGVRVFLAALGGVLAGLALPGTAAAGIPGGVAIVLGFHCVPVSDDGAIPRPMAPADLLPRATEPGLYDVWLFLHTRAPLIGAWTIAAALAYDTSPRGIEILSWERFTDEFSPYPGWPGTGCGFRAGWRRERCQDPDRFMDEGRDGWWVQPVLKLRVLVRGPGRLVFSDPEPGVRPQLTECADEMHELDGSESWSLVIPAVFGVEDPPHLQRASPSAPISWGALKARYGSVE